MKAKITVTKYIVIQQSAWCNDSGSGIYYSSDLVEFDKRDKAIKHGLKQCDSDDFNIGVLVNDRLTSLDWMNRVVDDEPEILAEISEHLGLDSDSEVQPAPIVPDDYFASLVAKARPSADKAMRKHPQPNYVLLKVAEEAGEVVQAGVHYAEGRMTWQDLEGEIVQLLAMLIRLVTEGDQVNGITPPDACRAAMPAEPVSHGYSYTLNSPVIPDGWKLVPNEPTAKQWAAGHRAMEGGIDKVTLAYRAMVEVAPSPGGPDDSHAAAT